MKKQFQFVAKSLLILCAGIALQSFSAPGGDYYKVVLNGKLITEQYLTKPAPVQTLSLTQTNNNDRLTIYYSHCGTAGKSRSISLRNKNGSILKEWKYTDSKDMNMPLPVKELLQASGKSNSASVYYTSKEIPSGKLLITLNLSAQTVAKL